MSLEQKIEELKKAIEFNTEMLVINNENIKKLFSSLPKTAANEPKTNLEQNLVKGEFIIQPEASNMPIVESKMKVKKAKKIIEIEEPIETEEEQETIKEPIKQEITEDFVRDYCKQIMAKGVDRTKIKEEITALNADQISDLTPKGLSDLYEKLKLLK